ncbi:MAG: 50S ribosomal protein L25 [Deinococcales bacterium]
MKLEASKRNSGEANALRNQGRLPAVVYNKQMNQTISVDLRNFDKVFRSQGLSHIIDLDIEGEMVEVLVKQVQMDKRKRIPQHVDFYAITRGQMLEVSIPIKYVGTAEGVRNGGQLDIKRREVRIKVLPRSIPEQLEIDISGLGLNQALHVSDLAGKLPEGASFIDSPSYTLITIVATRATLSSEAESAT